MKVFFSLEVVGRGSGTQLQVAENLSLNVSLQGLIKCGYLYSPKRKSEEIRDAIYLQALTILTCMHLSCLYLNMLKISLLEHQEKAMLTDTFKFLTIVFCIIKYMNDSNCAYNM